ncbi:MAG: adenosylcobinamide-phosphate synthase CbiB [Pseudomonadota bacterium]
MFDPLFLLLIALVIDWYLGEPEFLWSRLPHPVVFFGKVVSYLDKALNHKEHTPQQQYRNGSLAFGLMMVVALFVGLGLAHLVDRLGIFGFILEVFVVFVLLAQNSLAKHVIAVADGLDNEGLKGGQTAVGMIVGRDPELLDKPGVCRAAIESLAENFSDGVVAPAFWYLVFGLPGIIIYKMINTADSMIGYRNEKYLWFGRTAAQVDDLANWIPARISSLFIACGAGLLRGGKAFKHAMLVALRDSALHRSPNAGWPEAAMAGGANIALGGPRIYQNEIVQQAYLNGAGKRLLNASDIRETVDIFSMACFTIWVIIGVLAVIF